MRQPSVSAEVSEFNRQLNHMRAQMNRDIRQQCMEARQESEHHE